MTSQALQTLCLCCVVLIQDGIPFSSPLLLACQDSNILWQRVWRRITTLLNLVYTLLQHAFGELSIEVCQCKSKIRFGLRTSWNLHYPRLDARKGKGWSWTPNSKCIYRLQSTRIAMRSLERDNCDQQSGNMSQSSSTPIEVGKWNTRMRSWYANASGLEMDQWDAEKDAWTGCSTKSAIQ